MRTESKRFLAAAAWLAVLAAVPFVQTGGFAFVMYDDNVYVLANPVVRGGLTAEGLRWAFASGGYAANWHPLTWLSLMTDVSLFGVSAGAMHLVNVVLHAAGALVLLAILWRLTGNLGAAFLGAAFWAVHPLRVESVAWISERKDVLSAFLGLLAVFCHLKSLPLPVRPAPEASPRGEAWAGWRFLSAACFALAFLAKPTVVTFPVLAAFLEYALTGRIFWRHLEIPVWMSVLGAMVTVYVQNLGGAVTSVSAVPVWARILNAFSAIGIYVRDTILPLRVSLLHPWQRPEAVHVALGLGVCAVVGALALRVLRTGVRAGPAPAAAGEPPSPPPLLGIAGACWFLVALAPMLGIIQVGEQARADRFTYWPSVGLAVVAAWLLARCLDASRPRAQIRTAWVLSLAAILALAAASGRQAARWRNTETIFRWTLATGERNPTANKNLGLFLCLHDRYDEGIAHLRQAAAEAPHPTTILPLAGALVRAGKLDEAQKIVALVSDAGDGRLAPVLLGMIASRKREFRRAERFFIQAIAQEPALALAWGELGSVFAEESRWPEALAAWRRAVELDLTLAPVARLLRANGHRDAGRPPVAWQSLLEAGATNGPSWNPADAFPF
jgi:hypothetical protein